MKTAIALLLICVCTFESHRIDFSFLQTKANVYDANAVQAMIGSTFIKNGQDYSYNSFAGVKVITTYLTGSWFSYGVTFTETLKEFYNQVNANGLVYENVANLYEYSQAEWDAFSSTMPWALIPYGQLTIYVNYDIWSLPTLVLVNKDGSEAHRNGVSDVNNKGVEVFDEWAATVGGYVYEPPVEEEPVQDGNNEVDDASQQAFDESNKYRQGLGLVDFVQDNLLYEMCIEHNSYQIAAGKISHDGFSDRCYAIPNWQSCAENVCYNYDNANPGLAAVNQWIASEGHRLNLESANEYMGVSGVKDNNSGRWYFCQFFANHS